MTPFNFDSLSGMSAGVAGKAAMSAVTAVQALPAEQQIAGLALAFVVLTEKYKVHPTNAMQVVGNMLERMGKTDGYLRSLDSYVKHEL